MSSRKMDDLTITRLCAEAFGLCPIEPWSKRTAVFLTLDAMRNHPSAWFCDKVDIYSPLTNDAQAMQLVKQFKLLIGNRDIAGQYEYLVSNDGNKWTKNADLNRAICLCVASLSGRGK